ncbi:hypothetical protein Patl1_31771 [Pistacia atlantica]|uniref:Uncharacterized protein n=1 Tax=Pistacia atlantica TaxID=434234 RepID=A0ACC1ARV2_9ROSI|nr:hypothetical protein Patl1_31771 [Pistacia atlantica]
MATENTQHILHSNPPAQSPSSSQTPSIRKLGKHQSEAGFSPSEAPEAAKESGNSSDKKASNESNKEENLRVEGQKIHLKNNHHSVDKSVAGGGVILGGLATTFLVAVFCYIRATGRHKADNNQFNA